MRFNNLALLAVIAASFSVGRIEADEYEKQLFKRFQFENQSTFKQLMFRADNVIDKTRSMERIAVEMAIEEIFGFMKEYDTKEWIISPADKKGLEVKMSTRLRELRSLQTALKIEKEQKVEPKNLIQAMILWQNTQKTYGLVQSVQSSGVTLRMGESGAFYSSSSINVMQMQPGYFYYDPSIRRARFYSNAELAAYVAYRQQQNSNFRLSSEARAYAKMANSDSAPVQQDRSPGMSAEEKIIITAAIIYGGIKLLGAAAALFPDSGSSYSPPAYSSPPTSGMGKSPAKAEKKVEPANNNNLTNNSITGVVYQKNGMPARNVRINGILFANVVLIEEVIGPVNTDNDGRFSLSWKSNRSIQDLLVNGISRKRDVRNGAHITIYLPN